MATIEEDFPRGGTAKTTQTTKPEKTHVDVDNLFKVTLKQFNNPYVYVVKRARCTNSVE